MQRLIESTTLRERVYHAEVNGLGVYVMPKPGYLKTHAAYAVDFGSVDTNFRHPGTGEQVRVPDGIAHFLEHKMFETPDGSVMDEFSRIGASCNAYTDYTSTTYVFSASDRFDEALRVLLGFVQKPEFSREGVEKEKSIIEQELRMYQDMPSIQVETNLLGALYLNNPVRAEIGGTVESVKTISQDQLRLCYDSFYQPANMALVVVGDVDPERVVETVRDGVAGHARPKPPERLHPEEPETVAEHRVDTRMSLSLPLVMVGYKDTGMRRSGKDLLVRQATGDILTAALFGRSSAAYEKLYEQRLVGDRFSANFEAERTYGYATVGGETPEPDRLVEEIASTIDAALRLGIDSAHVSRLRRKLLGDFVMLFNSLEYVARLFVSMLFKGAHLFDYYEALEAVTESDVNDLLRQVFTEDRKAVSIVRPSEGS